MADLYNKVMDFLGKVLKFIESLQAKLGLEVEEEEA